MLNEYGFDLVPLTQGPKHHFFGYYDIPTWDSTGQYVLALESRFDDRFPTAEDSATIGMVEWESKAFHPLTETRAWNLQQGCMLHWLPTAPDRKIIYNDRQGDRFVSIVMDAFTGERRLLPRANNGLSHDGRYAVCHNFSRLRANRPVVGYAGPADPYADDPHPADDGAYLMDVETGETTLIVSTQQVYEYHALDELRDKTLWLNVVSWSPDDSRFLFLAKWRPTPDAGTKNALFVVNRDGTGLKCLLDYGYVSHRIWYDDNVILVTTAIADQGPGFYLLNVETGAYEIVGRGVLKGGHCSFTRDGRWFVMDTSPDANRVQTLKLWNMEEEREVVLGRFTSPPWATGDVRCDLHPRWGRADEWTCFDSAHDGTSQVYAVDVSGALGS